MNVCVLLLELVGGLKRMAMLYLEIVRELKRDMFTQLHVSFFSIIWLIALGKIWDDYACFVHKYTLNHQQYNHHKYLDI